MTSSLRVHAPGLRSRPCTIIAACLLALACSHHGTAQSTSVPSVSMSSAQLAEIASDWVDLNGPQSAGPSRVLRKYFADVMDFVVDVPSDPFMHPLLDPMLGSYIGEFLNARIQRLVDDLVADPGPAHGVRVYKLYSSGFILKSSDSTIAVDVAEGPFSILGLPGFSPAQIETLADELDAYFVTHLHGDHFSINLMGAMIARGKPVVTTPNIRGFLIGNGYDFGRRVTGIFERGRGQAGRITYHIFPGYQYLGFLDPQMTIPDLTQPHPQHNAYVFEFRDIVVAHLCENNERAILPWLRDMVNEGIHVEALTLLAGLHAEVMQILQPRTRFHAHEWEFTHFGTAFISLTMEAVEDSPLRRVSFWGESWWLPGR